MQNGQKENVIEPRRISNVPSELLKPIFDIKELKFAESYINSGSINCMQPQVLFITRQHNSRSKSNLLLLKDKVDSMLYGVTIGRGCYSKKKGNEQNSANKPTQEITSTYY